MSSSSTLQLPRVIILHAYSPLNAGDGLLVKLALELVKEAVGDAEVSVVASDAKAFDDVRVMQWRGRGHQILYRLPRRWQMLASLVTGADKKIEKAVLNADLIVAVGGGYLRGGGLKESLKSLGAHVGQLRLAAKAGTKAVYLPQSIGPFHGLYGRIVKRYLSRIAVVFVRDDRSAAEYSTVPGLVRAPDLAALAIGAATIAHASRISERTLVVARELPRPRTYYGLLDSMAASGDYEWAVQSRAAANDDSALTQRLAAGPVRTVEEVLAESSPRVVVSTRLHGALGAILAGHPAVHLSYERKGWGAFEDLGLGKYVLAARDASVDDVQALEAEIRAEPEHYWRQIATAIPHLKLGRDQVIDAISLAARAPKSSLGRSA